jgi:adenine-specific DNA-methyltransferase
MSPRKWGRRWITCDTSRVAVTLAKQRLMTASYDYYALRYPHEGLRGGFIWKTVPHVTLKSIANNPDIDAIYDRLHPAIEQALDELNKALKAEAKEWEVPFDFPGGSDKARAAFEAFHAARQAMQKAMDRSIADHADQETLYDQPAKSKSKLRITGPFSVEAVPSRPCRRWMMTILKVGAHRTAIFRPMRRSHARVNPRASTSGAMNC